MAVRLACIIEGKGELDAVPVLIRRILAEIGIYDAAILKPVRVRRDKLLKDSDNELARAMRLATAGTESRPRAILILIDSEGGCAVEISSALRRRAHLAHSDLRVEIVVAHREYETWFLAGASGLAGHRGLAVGLGDHSVPESVQDPKKWLTDRMSGSRAYSPTADQAAFSACLDMTTARQNSRSFEKFYRAIHSIAAQSQ